MNKIYPRKQALITGLVSGVFASSAFSLFISLNDRIGWGINPVTLRGLTGLLTILILAVGIYTGMQSIKRSNGQLSYGQALAAGILVGFTTGVLVAVIGAIYTNFINPGYPAYMLAENKKILIAEGKSTTEIAASQADMVRMLQPGIQVMQALVAQTGCAAIISLIMGLFLKTKKS